MRFANRSQAVFSGAIKGAPHHLADNQMLWTLLYGVAGRVCVVSSKYLKPWALGQGWIVIYAGSAGARSGLLRPALVAHLKRHAIDHDRAVRDSLLQFEEEVDLG